MVKAANIFKTYLYFNEAYQTYSRLKKQGNMTYRDASHQ